MGGGRRRVPLIAAVVLTALLGLYLWVVAGRAVALIRTGEPVGIALGIAFGVLPLLVLALIAREWMLAIDVQRMADTLADRGVRGRRASVGVGALRRLSRGGSGGTRARRRCPRRRAPRRSRRTAPR